MTEGERVDFGGSFEALIKKLSDPGIPENKRYLTRTRSELTRKDSRIYPNIPLIMTYLRKKEDKKRRGIVFNTLNNDTVVRHRGIVEMPIIIEEKLVAKVKRSGMGESTTMS